MVKTSETNWIIGSLDECDIVIDKETVSGRHCRLRFADGTYTIEDLDSTNGTFVNGVQIEAQREVTRRDRLQLGQTVELSWEMVPRPDTIEIAIGRSSDNDVVVASSVVSSKHAMLILDGATINLEDLGTTNGTFVKTPDHKIDSQRVGLLDPVYLGTYRTRVDRLIKQAAKHNPTVAQWWDAHAANDWSVGIVNARTGKLLLGGILGVVIIVAFVLAINFIPGIGEQDSSLAQTADKSNNATPDAAPPVKQPEESSQAVIDEDQPSPKPPSEVTETEGNQQRSNDEQPSNGKSSDDSLRDGSESGIYSVVVRSEEDGLAFQIGTAWAVGGTYLVTSAEVIHAISQQDDGMDAVEVYWGHGDRLKVTGHFVHPQYAEAEQAAQSAYDQYQKILQDQTDNLDPDAQKELESKVLGLNKNFQEASARMVYFDIGLLQVELPSGTSFEKTLVVAPTPVNRIKGRDVRVSGNAYLLRDEIEFDPDGIQTTELGAEFLISTRLSNDQSAHFVVHVECAENEVDELRTKNWMGSPVFDKNQQVVGIFSRLAKPEQAEADESSDAPVPQAQRVFVMPLVDRLTELDQLRGVFSDD